MGIIIEENALNACLRMTGHIPHDILLLMSEALRQARNDSIRDQIVIREEHIAKSFGIIVGIWKERFLRQMHGKGMENNNPLFRLTEKELESIYEAAMQGFISDREKEIIGIENRERRFELFEQWGYIVPRDGINWESGYILTCQPGLIKAAIDIKQKYPS